MKSHPTSNGAPFHSIYNGFSRAPPCGFPAEPCFLSRSKDPCPKVEDLQRYHELIRELLGRCVFHPPMTLLWRVPFLVIVTLTLPATTIALKFLLKKQLILPKLWNFYPWTEKIVGYGFIFPLLDILKSFMWGLQVVWGKPWLPSPETQDAQTCLFGDNLTLQQRSLEMGI